jgi:hypothetical protein
MANKDPTSPAPAIAMCFVALISYKRNSLRAEDNKV